MNDFYIDDSKCHQRSLALYYTEKLKQVIFLVDLITPHILWAIKILNFVRISFEINCRYLTIMDKINIVFFVIYRQISLFFFNYFLDK